MLHRRELGWFLAFIATLAEYFTTGGAATSVISASEKLVYVAGLRLGVLSIVRACWRFVRDKLVINIDYCAEALVI